MAARPASASYANWRGRSTSRCFSSYSGCSASALHEESFCPTRYAISSSRPPLTTIHTFTHPMLLPPSRNHWQPQASNNAGQSHKPSSACANNLHKQPATTHVACDECHKQAPFDLANLPDPRDINRLPALPVFSLHPNIIGVLLLTSCCSNPDSSTRALLSTNLTHPPLNCIMQPEHLTKGRNLKARV